MADSEPDGEQVALGVDDPELLDAVVQLLQSATDTDKKRLLAAYPKLLSDAALDLLSQIEDVHRTRGDEAAAASTAGLGDIVKRAISHGAEFGMLQQLVFEAIVKAPDDFAGLQHYFDTVADRFPELLQPLALDVLDLLHSEDRADMGFIYQRMREGIQRVRQPLLAMPTDPSTAFVLALNLLYEYDRSGGLHNLDGAIRHAKAAMAHGARSVAALLDNLGVAYKLRYYLTAVPDDLDFAVECHHRVHEIGPVDDPHRASYEDHYALALRARYVASPNDDTMALDESIAISERLVEGAWDDPNDRAIALENLANSLVLRYEATGAIEDLVSAVERFDLACAGADRKATRARILVSAAPAMLKLGLKTKDETVVARARASFTQAASDASDMAHPLFTLGYNWTLKTFGRGMFEDAAAGYAVALDAVRELVLVAERQDASRRYWLRDFQWLIEDGVYALARVGRYQDAVLALESGLNLLAVHRQREAGARGTSLKADVTSAFTIDDVYARIPEGWSGAYVLCTAAGGVVLLVHYRTVTPIWFPSLNSEALNHLVFGTDPDTTVELRNVIVDISESDGYLGAQARWRRDQDEEISDPDVVDDWRVALHDACVWLWDHALGDFQRELSGLSIQRLLLIPVGSLAGLPFHAAYGRAAGDPQSVSWFIDAVDVSYATSIASLQTGRPGALPERAAVVADVTSLAFAGLEAANVVAAVGDGAILTEAAGDWSGLPLFLSGNKVWHLACHSQVDPFVNQVGRLVMPGGVTLRVDQIVGGNAVAADLVALSSCASGAPTRELLTENLSLATDFVRAGARHVVASAWPVDDGMACVFMAYFYRMLGQTQWDVSAAVRATQHWMRDTPVASKLAFVDALQPAPSARALGARITANSDDTLLWWAAFFAVRGAAS